MSERSTELANRRRALLAQSDVQRGVLANSTRDIEQRLRGVDHVIDLAKRVVVQPMLLAGALTVVMMVGPRRLLRWAGRGLVLFSTGRKLLRRSGR